MKYLPLTILAIAFYFFLPALASAAGIEVSPSKLEVTVSSAKNTAELFVANPTPDVQVFDVFADDFPDNVKSDPTSFTLEAGGRKKIILTFKASGLPNNSKITTFISVVATPLAEGRLQARTGVKIPLSLSIENSPWYAKIPMWAYVLLLILAVSSVTFALGRKFKLK